MMLDTQFPRERGDICNPDTFDFPVRYAVVPHASPARVVRENASELLEPFIQAGRKLVSQGAIGLATSCGFLVRFQRQLAHAVPVPVATSSLLQAAWIRPMLRENQRVGLLTLDAEALTADVLQAAGVPADAPVVGIATDSELYTSVIGNLPSLNARVAEAEVKAAGLQLIERCPEVAAIVIESSNMSPYSHAVAQSTGRPVYDAVSLLNWFWNGLSLRYAL
jgi:hypothetical protein